MKRFRNESSPVFPTKKNPFLHEKLNTLKYLENIQINL